MKIVFKSLITGGLMIVTSVASAAESPFSANAALTSDYRFRGVSQSAKDVAVQGGADYAHESGWYAGIWGSTIDFGVADKDADIEIDLYGGYGWKGAGIDWDVGILHYAYPGSKSSNELPFTEVYLGGTYGPVTVKYFYTGEYTGTVGAPDDDAYYLSAAASFELGDGYTLGLSVGKSGGDGIDFIFGDSYTDYKIGVSKDFAGFTFDLSYVDTSGISPDIKADEFNSEGTVALTVSKTF